MPRPPLKHDIALLLLLTALMGGLLLLPAPPAPGSPDRGFTARAKVVETDNADVARHDLVLFGSQRLRLEILEGPCKGMVFPAGNQLRAQLELDKLFQPGDIVIAVSPNPRPQPGDELTAQDYARGRWTAALFFVFCLLLCLFAHLTGFNALLSFVFSCLLLWKVIIPLVLKGWPASWTIFACVVFLTAIIMYLVAGLTRCGLCAFCGSITGVFAGLFTAHFFSQALNINGAVMPYAQTLLFSGYPHLDLRDIFLGAMILASSGAVMDLGMDIASGQAEVARHHPEISRRELVRSGLRMGRNVVGTMTTTLLLAYSGGYLTLLMMFAAQGNSPWDILNNPLVAAEVAKTLIGSFSLVLVAPATAFLGGWILLPRHPRRTP